MSTWEKGDREGLISIGTHKLFARISGPERRFFDPLLIVEAGLGDSSTGWQPFQRLVSMQGLGRILLYDRSGLGRSETSPLDRSAETMATELCALLDAARLSGPYIVIAHSYGGTIAREFVAQRRPEVIGMVFVDAEQEDTATVMNVPWNDLFAILGDLDYYSVTGVDKEHQLSSNQWEALMDDAVKTQAANDAETMASHESASKLASRHQLRHRILEDSPVAVLKANSLRDYARILQAGVAMGNGTDKQRQATQELMERMRTKEEPLQRALLQLSRCNRFATTDAGHNVHLTRPSAIVSELRWVLSRASQAPSAANFARSCFAVTHIPVRAYIDL